MAEAQLSSVILIGICILLSAFFSSSEAAYLKLERVRLAHLVNTGRPGAKRIASWIESPERLLSTILLGNNLVNVAFTALITVVALDLLGEGREGIATVIATVVGTALLLVFGETHTQNYRRASVRTARVLVPADRFACWKGYSGQ